MTRKNTVDAKTPFRWPKKDAPACFTPAELGRYLGVSRQRAWSMLNAGRVQGAVKLQDGRWQAWLPLRVLPGQRGPVGPSVGRFKPFERPEGHVVVQLGGTVVPLRGWR